LLDATTGALDGGRTHNWAITKCVTYCATQLLQLVEPWWFLCVDMTFRNWIFWSVTNKSYI